MSERWEPGAGQTKPLPPFPVIVGPTAVGKTAVAIGIAEALNGEVVSADSRQIYRGMEIGSGAPSMEERARVKHHLFAEIEPDVRLSAGEFARMARVRIDEVLARGKLPIVVGGSGLYVRALLDGLAPMPPANPTLRREIEAEIDSRGMEAMIGEFAQFDPDYAVKVGLRDRKRLVRALEVLRLTGKPFSRWHKPSQEPWCQASIFGLARPRPELLQLIERRIRGMIEAGWIEEIKALAGNYGGLERLPSPVNEALGYKQLIRYLKGEVGLNGAEEEIVIATRQFAKRQMTWFHADHRIRWLEESGDAAVKRWQKQIIRNLGTL